MPPKKGSKKRQSEPKVIFAPTTQVDSFEDLAREVKLQESYKSLFLGIAVVLLATVLIFGYLKNRSPRPTPTASQIAVITPTPRKDVLGEYTVQTGDDLKTIAIKYYNTPEPYVFIAKENNITNPDQIDEGKKLSIPKLDKNTFLAPLMGKPLKSDKISDTSYTVQDGDVLWDIAVRAYDDGNKWDAIAKANNLPSPDAIFSGMILQLPR